MSSPDISSLVAAKMQTGENFPVGSIFIPKALRADIHDYYRYARIADDVADHPSLSATHKLDILTALEMAVLGEKTCDSPLDIDSFKAATRIGDRLRDREIDLSVATDLLVAFRMDAENLTCNTWADLIDYCRFSACPVGRFLLALHDETHALAESDSLCCALQILNHIQHARDDYTSLQRIYIPLDWLAQDGAHTDDLSQDTSSQELKSSIARMLEHTDQLILRARNLPNLLTHRGLSAESDLCVGLAQKLSSRLKRADPLQSKIKLTKFNWLASGLHSLLHLVRP